MGFALYPTRCNIVLMLRIVYSSLVGRWSLKCRQAESCFHKAGVATFVVLSIALLVASFFGPVLDHHFTERLPQHEHVYLGDATPDHAHPFETQHSHNEALDEAAPHEHAGAPDITVYLAPDDESGPNSNNAGFALTSRLIAQVPPDPLRYSYLAAEKDLSARYISPPIRPPRI